MDTRELEEGIPVLIMDFTMVHHHLVLIQINCLVLVLNLNSSQIIQIRFNLSRISFIRLIGLSAKSVVKMGILP